MIVVACDEDVSEANIIAQTASIRDNSFIITASTV